MCADTDTRTFNDKLDTITYSWSALYYNQQVNNSSKCSSNSETNASELLENLEEIYSVLHAYYAYSNIQPHNIVSSVANKDDILD